MAVRSVPVPFRSALYEGAVFHRRASPAHAFRFPVAMPLLFLDELKELDALSVLATLDPARRPHLPTPLRLRRTDVLPGPEPTLPDAVHASLGHDARGAEAPVALLTLVRTWGWLFNPLSIAFCFDESGQRVTQAVLEVTNTPWHERCRYVVGGPGMHHFEKRLHVSPFLPTEGHYTLQYTEPGEHLQVCLSYRAEHTKKAAPADAVATLSLHRRTLDRAALHRLLWGFPLQTARVSAEIYRQAWRLRLAGAPVHHHPERGPRGQTPARRHGHGGEDVMAARR